MLFDSIKRSNSIAHLYYCQRMKIYIISILLLFAIALVAKGKKVRCTRLSVCSGFRVQPVDRIGQKKMQTPIKSLDCRHDHGATQTRLSATCVTLTSMRQMLYYSFVII